MKILDTTLFQHILEYEVVLIPMGLINSFSRGFLSWVNKHYPNVKLRECELSPYGDRRKMGTILPIKEYGVTFVMCYIHDGGFNTQRDTNVYLNYEALDSCLNAVAAKYKNKRIASIVMGTEREDGNGDKANVMEIFEKYFGGNDNFDIYSGKHWDFEWIMHSQREYFYRKYRRREIDKETLRFELSKIDWQRKNGIYEPMPEDYRIKFRKKMNLLTVKKEDIEKKKAEKKKK